MSRGIKCVAIVLLSAWLVGWFAETAVASIVKTGCGAKALVLAFFGQRAAEKKFKHRVDFPVPMGGLGNRLNQMLAWCVMNIRAEKWGQHGHSEKQPGQIAVDHARFYFLTAEDADLFR